MDGGGSAGDDRALCIQLYPCGFVHSPSLSSDRTLASSYEELVGRGDGGGTQLRRYLNLSRYNIYTLSGILLGVATQLFVDGILGFRPRSSTGIVSLLGYFVGCHFQYSYLDIVYLSFLLFSSRSLEFRRLTSSPRLLQHPRVNTLRNPQSIVGACP